MNEDELIAHLRRVLPVGERTQVWSGDDCAQIATPEGHAIVTTDVLVDNRHFRRDWFAPAQVGARAAAQNLADIAAQGGRPTALVVAVTVPDDLESGWLEEMVRGFAGQVAPTGAGVVGGDLSGGEELTIAVTALGYCPHAGVLRSGAIPGDVVAVSGTLGYAAAGFDLLQSGRVPTSPGLGEALGPLAEFVEVFRVPNPPYESGVAAARTGAHALMDVSDGLSTDATRMAHASEVTIDLESERLAPFVRALQDPTKICEADPWKWVLHGGEDHSLLAAFPPGRSLPPSFVPIGRVSQQVDKQPLRLDGEVLAAAGWDHFSAVRATGLGGRA